MKKINVEIKCPYCGRIAVLHKASYIYKKNTNLTHLYVCSGYPFCDSYVGVHEGSIFPKGTLANSMLRKKRIKAHSYFDQLWKHNILTRKDAYCWLQNTMHLTKSQAHIGKLSCKQCDLLIQECIKFLNTFKITEKVG